MSDYIQKTLAEMAFAESDVLGKAITAANTRIAEQNRWAALQHKESEYLHARIIGLEACISDALIELRELNDLLKMYEVDANSDQDFHGDVYVYVRVNGLKERVARIRSALASDGEKM
jgi:hypothetical protein